ncbi:hypothetical protein [Thalassospira sp.]|uniref:hypothetical protein n=1 Tax=Thalassospira sp. TaxID=1912094 RepID=UPI001B2456BD|nr:hypothetical protein [Thalassospira sp.]MBO6809246.1 hypothetical protein [Thalassospira sp.]
MAEHHAPALNGALLRSGMTAQQSASVGYASIPARLFSEDWMVDPSASVLANAASTPATLSNLRSSMHKSFGIASGLALAP